MSYALIDHPDMEHGTGWSEHWPSQLWRFTRHEGGVPQEMVEVERVLYSGGAAPPSHNLRFYEAVAENGGGYDWKLRDERLDWPVLRDLLRYVEQKKGLDAEWAYQVIGRRLKYAE